jgi:hypothetical protein
MILTDNETKVDLLVAPTLECPLFVAASNHRGPGSISMPISGYHENSHDYAPLDNNYLFLCIFNSAKIISGFDLKYLNCAILRYV